MIKYIMKIRFGLFVLMCIVIVSSMASSAFAQLSGFHSVYYQNQYLANPSLAGLEDGLTLNAGYQQQWSSIPGSPTLKNLTAEYGAGNRVGLGLQVNTDQAGLISRTRMMGTYAYHLPLNDQGSHKLNFGVSFGISDSYLDYARIVGDKTDITAQNFYQRAVYADGDFGIAYTSEGLNVQVSLPNLKRVFFGTDAANLEIDRAVFYTAMSYKMLFDNDVSEYILEPKLAYRGLNGVGNIFDFGLNLTLPDKVFNNLSGVYHSNQSTTLSAGFLLDQVGLLFAYNFNTGPLSTYAQDTFEIGLSYKLNKKKSWF
jgi:type IX secretion system PorP/SprF family membrane protein